MLQGILNHAVPGRTDSAPCGMQTQCGRALAVPLFVVLAQNRALHIVGQDRGVGQVDPTLRPEDRIRVVSDRFDQANRLLVQASLCTPYIAGLLPKLPVTLLYHIPHIPALPCKTVTASTAYLTSGLKCVISNHSGSCLKGCSPVCATKHMLQFQLTVCWSCSWATSPLPNTQPFL